jgi:hypothetical protein
MKNTLLSILAVVLTVFIVGFGLTLTKYFMESEIGVLPFIVGMIGYFISLRPAVNEWEKRFKTWFKVDDE